MAITLADFTKIWASTSPLTPYSFSESNYKEGWNFIGATPPARQMWDSIQKQNDEKLKYIVDNFLPLSGGTMTGDITLDGGAIVGNPLTLTADDGNGNSADMVINANGVATLSGNNVATTNLQEITVTMSSNMSALYINAGKRFGNIAVISFDGSLVSTPAAWTNTDLFTMSVSSVGAMNCVGHTNNGTVISLQVTGNKVVYRPLDVTPTHTSIRGTLVFPISGF